MIVSARATTGVAISHVKSGELPAEHATRVRGMSVSTWLQNNRFQGDICIGDTVLLDTSLFDRMGEIVQGTSTAWPRRFSPYFRPYGKLMNNDLGH